MSQDSSIPNTSLTMSTNNTSSPEHPNLQARRLKLRNAGFRAPAFHTRRISPALGASPQAVDQFSGSRNKEMGYMNADMQTMYENNLATSPVNILQEIHNSTRRRRQSSPRRGIATIFGDNTAENDTENLTETSWYNETSNTDSPAALDRTPSVSKLREGSLNQKTSPSLNLALAKQLKSETITRSHRRSTSPGTSQHIEYLESELAKVKLDSGSSTISKKQRSVKMRGLITENKDLRLQNTEWESKFDERIREEERKHLESETEMKIELAALEDDVRMKDAKIGELEWELESMKVKARDVEGLEEINIDLEKRIDMLTKLLVESMKVKARDVEGVEEINIDLEKRIDMLTKLLVESPSKLDAQSTVSSPCKADPSRRARRRRSMLTRWASSPGGGRLFGTIGPEAAPWQSGGFGYSPEIQESLEESPRIDQDSGFIQSPCSDEGMRSPLCPRQSEQSSFFESHSIASPSLRSAPSSSRPTSFISASSFSATSCGLPLPTESEVKSTTKRKMRKFPSGSNSLKPLILPTTSAIPSYPASAPFYPSIETTAEQDLSEISIDPTTSFLSRPDDVSPRSTPTQPMALASTEWTEDQTTKTVEGNRVQATMYEDTQNSHAGILGETLPTSKRLSFQERIDRLARPKSLCRELEQAELAYAGLGISGTSSPEPFGDVSTPIKRVVTPESGEIMIGMDQTPSKLSIPDGLVQQRHQIEESEVTPRPPKQSPTDPPSSKRKSQPSAFISPFHACGMFYHLTNLISQTKQDPLELAKRILANAWTLGSKRLGGVGWWLLGLVHHRGKQKDTTDKWIGQSGADDNCRLSRFNIWPCNWLQDPQAILGKPSQSRQPTEQHLNEGSRETAPSFPTDPHPKHSHLHSCPICVEPSSRRTLRLWLHFSLTMVLAVGMALKDGPGTLLAEVPCCSHQEMEARSEHHRKPPLTLKTQIGEGDAPEDTLGIYAFSGREEGSVRDSGYGSIVFAETLVPTDFETGDPP